MKHRLLLLLMGVELCLAVKTSSAAPEPNVPRGRLRFLWQNDSWFSDSDRFYTNGIGLGWTLADGPSADAIERGLSWLPFRPDEYSGTDSEFFLRQDMYTPEDFTNPNLVENDRPYAGWLHLDFTHYVLTLASDARGDRLDTWQLEVGIVGSSSLADDTQRMVHELVDAPEPRGWDYQLEDEPGFVLGYRRDVRIYHNPNSILGAASDIASGAGVRLGNVDTSVHLGSTVHFGWHLPRHFGTAIRGGMLDDHHRFYFSTGVEGRWVLRNIFLDGNTFADSHSVDRNALVADFHLGLHWEPCDRFHCQILEVFVTPEFDSPSQQGDVGHYTSIQIECFF